MMIDKLDHTFQFGCTLGLMLAICFGCGFLVISISFIGKWFGEKITRLHYRYSTRPKIADIKLQYEQLLHDVATKDFYKNCQINRVNCYRCAQGHITKTIDVDPGVTPFMFQCATCGDMAQSTGYRDIAPGRPATIEWYRPSLKETLKWRNNPGMVDHILRGGLDDRKHIALEITNK